MFLSQLQSLSAAVTQVDRDLNNGKTATVLRIAELSFRSPIRVVLEPETVPNRFYVIPAILDRLEHVTDALANGDDLSGVDADLLEDIRGLTRPVGKTVKSAALVFRDRTFELTESVGSKVERALAVDEECEGSIEGMLEQINLHHGANIFHIYPDVGPRKVTCKFPPKLYDDAVYPIRLQILCQRDRPLHLPKLYCRFLSLRLREYGICRFPGQSANNHRSTGTQAMDSCTVRAPMNHSPMQVAL